MHKCHACWHFGHVQLLLRVGTVCTSAVVCVKLRYGMRLSLCSPPSAQLSRDIPLATRAAEVPMVVEVSFAALAAGVAQAATAIAALAAAAAALPSAVGLAWGPDSWPEV